MSDLSAHTPIVLGYRADIGYSPWYIRDSKVMHVGAYACNKALDGIVWRLDCPIFAPT